MIFFYLAQVTLFCAARNSSVQAPSVPFIFDQLIAQRGQSYNLTTGYFKPQVSGTYVFHLSSAIPPLKPINLAIQKNSVYANIYRTTISHNGWDTTSRNAIYNLAKDTQIYLNLSFGFAGCGPMRQASWSVFLLDNLVQPLVTFWVGRTSSLTTIGKIDYTSMIVNVGSAWDMTTNKFTAPYNGVYVFSLNCGALGGQGYDVYVYVNNVVTHAMALTSTSHNGIDISSRTFAISLMAGDVVFSGLSWGMLFSDTGYETSFSGFLYEPRNVLKVIWSVHQTTNTNSQSNPLPFDDVAVNVGNGWNAVTNKFAAPHSGVYQLHLTLTSNVPVQGQLNFLLVWNNVNYANIFIDKTNQNGRETRSRSIMIDASAGDQFWIAINANRTNYYTNSNKLISFTGFFLSP